MRRKRKIRETHDIGRYNKRIMIQEQTSISDGTFGANPVWNDLKLVWAKQIKRGDTNQYNDIAGKKEFFQFNNFRIQYSDKIYSIPKKKLRIVYPSAGKNMAIWEINAMDKVEGESLEIEFVCRGSERGL